MVPDFIIPKEIEQNVSACRYVSLGVCVIPTESGKFALFSTAPGRGFRGFFDGEDLLEILTEDWRTQMTDYISNSERELTRRNSTPKEPDLAASMDFLDSLEINL